IWHAGSMILARPSVAGAAAAGERSAWMIAGMLGCLFVVVALGVHLPGELASLLGSARHLLEVPR
ncbi:MAG: hypothetical protein ACRDKL_08815, partial [Solirubrobacteraceae bacterium]